MKVVVERAGGVIGDEKCEERQGDVATKASAFRYWDIGSGSCSGEEGQVLLSIEEGSRTD